MQQRDSGAEVETRVRWSDPLHPLREEATWLKHASIVLAFISCTPHVAHKLTGPSPLEIDVIDSKTKKLLDADLEYALPLHRNIKNALMTDYLYKRT